MSTHLISSMMIFTRCDRSNAAMTHWRHPKHETKFSSNIVHFAMAISEISVLKFSVLGMKLRAKTIFRLVINEIRHVTCFSAFSVIEIPSI